MPLTSPRSIVLPGLRVSGTTPGERRHFVLHASDDALAGLLFEQMQALRQQARDTWSWAALADCVQAPTAEVFGSPFALRAVALAAERGACLVHHELRVPVAWADELHGDDRVAEEEHGQWIRGNLHTSKYQGFLQDDPLSAYQPHHMAKWTPHELLHRAACFFWRADASNWELYIGARLNELVPVVLWYGVDEIGRRDGAGFDRAAWAAQPGVSERDASWLLADDERLRSLASAGAPLLRESVAHFEREWAAIERELTEGVRVPVPHPVLDASSDALAYVVGHATRLRDRALVRCIERTLRDGRDYFADVIDYAEHVETLMDRLLFADVEPDVRSAMVRRDASVLRDWVQRAAHLGWAVFRRVVPLLPDVQGDMELAWHGRPVDLTAWRNRLLQALGDENGGLVLANGYHPATDSGTPAPTAAQPPHVLQLREGLMSVCPRTVQWCDRAMPGVVDAFAGSACLWSRAPLPERLAAFLAERDAAEEGLGLLRLEQAIARVDSRIDDDIEVLGLDPEEVDPHGDGALIWNRTFERHAIPAAALALHAESSDVLDPAPAVCLIGTYRAGVSVLPLWEPLAGLVVELQQGPVELDDFVERLARALRAAPELPAELDRDAWEWTRELLDSGAVAYIPRLARSRAVAPAPS